MKTYVLIMILVAFQRSGPGYAGGPAIHHVPFETLELCELAIARLRDEGVKNTELYCVQNGGKIAP